jgi:hypothetical protein
MYYNRVLIPCQPVGLFRKVHYLDAPVVLHVYVVAFLYPIRVRHNFSIHNFHTAVANFVVVNSIPTLLAHKLAELRSGAILAVTAAHTPNLATIHPGYVFYLHTVLLVAMYVL